MLKVTAQKILQDIRDFERVKMLNLKGMSQSEIRYITSLSESLVIEYIKITKE